MMVPSTMKGELVVTSWVDGVSLHAMVAEVVFSSWVGEAILHAMVGEV